MNTEEDYLKKLVSFASVSTDQNESKKCAQYCADFFIKAGLHTNIIEHKGYPNVIATTRKTKKPKIFLYCHMDVVPGKLELFQMKKIDGKLTGRGVFDMKFACASYMKLIDKLGKIIDQYDFGVMLVFDEEIGGRNGAEALLKDGYSCEVCVLPDSGRNWQIECEAKGPWFIRISMSGKNAHGSVAFEGVNAAELLLPATNEIVKLRDDYNYLDLSLNLTEINSGTAMNQIPDHAECVFDIRFRDKQIFEKVKSQIEHICQKYQAKLETIEYGDCMNFDKEGEHIVSYKAIAEQVLEKPVEFYGSPGANDGRYFCAYGIDCVIMQPVGGCMHSDDEWIESGGMEKFTEINLRFIKQYAKITR